MLGDQKSGNNIISTHALTEGDSLIGNNSYAGNISTHALTEGDDSAGIDREGSFIISTHALTEGDSMRIHCVIAKSDISTHALTEGDHTLPVSHHCSLYFNSRPHGGRRQILSNSLCQCQYFNSRPHGGRHVSIV